MRTTVLCLVVTALGCSESSPASTASCDAKPPTTPCAWSSRIIVWSGAAGAVKPSGCKDDPIVLPSGIDVCQMRVYEAGVSESDVAMEVARSDWQTDGKRLWWTERDGLDCTRIPTEDRYHGDIVVTVGCRLSNAPDGALCLTGSCVGGECPCEPGLVVSDSLVDDDGNAVYMDCAGGEANPTAQRESCDYRR